MSPAENVGTKKSLKYSKKAAESLSLMWEIQSQETPAEDKHQTGSS